VRTATPARLVPAAVWAVGAAIFFRTPIFSGFDTLTGDEGDVRLVVFLHEHWWKVVQGDAGWRDPPAFFPADDVLSYSDTFVLNTVLYVPLRLIGVDPFVAVQLCVIALTGLGFAAVYLLLRRHVGLERVACSLLAAAVAFANNLYIDTAHAQLFSVNVVALIVLLALEAWRAPPPVAPWWAAASGAGLGLLLWSNFYFGWFAVVAAAVAGSVTAVLLVATGGATQLVAAVGARWRPIVAAVGAISVGLVPFLITYWPALGDRRSRSYQEVAGLAPRPFDTVNVGRDNVAWGWLMRSLTDDDERLVQLNRAVALTPLLLIATLLAGVMLAADWRRHGRSPLAFAGVVASITSLALIVLPVQFGFGGAWAWLHRLVPGGSAIRVYARIELVTVLTAVIAVACALKVLECQHIRRIPSYVLTLVVLVIAGEQINTTENFRELDRRPQVAMLDAVPAAPDGCRAFWVVPPSGRNADHASIDAMLIAHRIGIPTLNGYSGWMPDGWDLQPGSETYTANVAAWIEQHGLTGTTCAYDLDAHDWR
jgi:hypothetical protein